ncbi:MAG TPA: HEAT repeat domain-containing protein, partial [Pirellulaceae bacterium]|nr:HEAT repeat domain-containing protein [Pirellulaceae bacterium]
VYGKVHDVIESHQRTGDILPPLSHLGPAAPCGLTRYESAVFGPEFQDNIFASLFNLHKVTRHVLTPSGATFQSRDEDFVVSTNLDFHPTDVQADADGSLVIVDTGGWYKLCCPTSQLWKPDILGGVYRVRRTGAPKVEDPRGVKLAWDKLTGDELARLLGDDRPAVRRHAARQLAKLGPSAVAPVARLLGAKSERTREEAVWALTRIDAPAARAAVRTATDDAEDTVRQAALHSISLWRDRDAGPQLLKLLASDSAHNVRAAAEGLGRLGDPASVAPLVNRIEQLAARVGVQSASGRSPSIADRFVEHGLMFALIEIADAAATRKALEHPSPWVRRSALIALDQMYGGGLEPQQVAPQLSSTEPIVRDTAAWLVGRHPEWGGALAGYLKDRLAAKQLAEAERGELQKQLATFAKHAAIQELLANVAGDSGAPATGRAIALQAMRDAGLKEAPAAWWNAIGAAVSASEPEVVAQAVATARGLPAPKQPPGELLGALLSLGQDSGRSPQVRLDALAAIPGGVPQVSDATWTFLVGQLGSDVAVPLRMTSADVLSRARLATSQLLSLTDVVRAVGPLEADRLLGAFERSTDEAVGLALIDALMKSS